MTEDSIDFLFHPRSIALVGVTTTRPEHWTRSLLEGLLEFRFDGRLYVVNPRGGHIEGQEVYRSLQEIPGTIDYVIGLVPAPLAPKLVEESASKGAQAIHFCTAGFSETGQEEGIRLEGEVARIAQEKGIRVIGPNCVGIYCPKSKLSFGPIFPKESGSVAFASQSGGNSSSLVREAAIRGVRFSKVISYGNACDLNEADFLEYLATDKDTKIICLYIEGIKDGERFRKALEMAARSKPVIIHKGGLTDGGARAIAGHTASLAGSRTTWQALCRQYGVISVDSLDEMADVLVALLFATPPGGRNAAMVGAGGGASVMVADEFERHGLAVPPFPSELVEQIREFTPIAGNILQNPLDYSQTMFSSERLYKAIDLIIDWDGIDFLVKFLRTKQSVKMGAPSDESAFLTRNSPSMGNGAPSKPEFIVIEPSVIPEEEESIFKVIQECVHMKLPVFYSFGSAARAIDLVLDYHENRAL